VRVQGPAFFAHAHVINPNHVITSLVTPAQLLASCPPTPTAALNSTVDICYSSIESTLVMHPSFVSEYVHCTTRHQTSPALGALSGLQEDLTNDASCSSWLHYYYCWYLSNPALLTI
jgi:hypothetical protein